MHRLYSHKDYALGAFTNSQNDGISAGEYPSEVRSKLRLAAELGREEEASVSGRTIFCAR